MCLLPTDDVAPYFKTEPVRTQVHLEGNRLVLTCMAEGSWPLEFKWLHNNKELTKFSLEYRQAALPLPSAPGVGGRSHCPAPRGARVGGLRCSLGGRVSCSLTTYWEAGAAEADTKESLAPGVRRPRPAEPRRRCLGAALLDRVAQGTGRRW